MINIAKFAVVLPFALLLTSCLSSDPGNQCLDSFRSNLKDPDSGKVLEFRDNILTYTATNSYGARIQGRAFCTESDGKWARDRYQESVMIDKLYLKKLNIESESLEKSNACREAGGTRSSCLGKSLEEPAVDIDAHMKKLRKESANELGFN